MKIGNWTRHLDTRKSRVQSQSLFLCYLIRWDSTPQLFDDCYNDILVLVWYMCPRVCTVGAAVRWSDEFVPEVYVNQTFLGSVRGLLRLRRIRAVCVQFTGCLNKFREAWGNRKLVYASKAWSIRSNLDESTTSADSPALIPLKTQTIQTIQKEARKVK